MPDTFSPAFRSEIMRRVKGKDTAFERKVRSALHRRGLRFRLYSSLPGKPDIVFTRARVVVFLDSCFWHGCPKHLRTPSSHVEYWTRKIERNRARDAKTNAAYIETGWKVVRLWEHELKGDFERCLRTIERTILRRTRPVRKAQRAKSVRGAT